MTPERIALEVAARDLVDRAREGDQNAMAMLAAVGQSASAGSARAAEAKKVASAYAKATRRKSSRVGSEIAGEGCACLRDVSENGPLDGKIALFSLPKYGRAAMNAGAVLLSNLGDISGNDVARIAGEIEHDDARAAFLSGAARRALREFRPFALFVAVGLMVSDAARIQALRNPNIPISRVAPDIGWELGE